MDLDRERRRRGGLNGRVAARLPARLPARLKASGATAIGAIAAEVSAGFDHDRPWPPVVRRRSAAALLSAAPAIGGVPCPGGGGRWGRDLRHGESESRSRPRLFYIVGAAGLIFWARGSGDGTSHPYPHLFSPVQAVSDCSCVRRNSSEFIGDPTSFPHFEKDVGKGEDGTSRIFNSLSFLLGPPPRRQRIALPRS
jgi:hypothetical protein